MQEASSGDEWDRVWVGANIATMVAGAARLWQAQRCALAVKGERIAWIGAAERGARAVAGAQGIPIEECRGPVDDAGTHRLPHAPGVRRQSGRGIREAAVRRAVRGDCARRRRHPVDRQCHPCAPTSQALAAAAAIRARRLMAEGVTTLEVKSGYGLDLATERRMLEVARALERELPVSIRDHIPRAACVAAGVRDRRHELRRRGRAVPGSSRSPPRAWWMRSMRSARTSPSPLEETRPVSRAAGRLGLRAHVHAGQLSDMGAAELAARYGALSADHLEYLSERRRARARPAGTVAVLLARRLLHAAADHAAAGPAVARGRRADGRRHRRQSRHLALHVDSARAQHGLHAVRPDAGGGASPARRACGASARAASTRSARSRWESAPISRSGGSSGRRSSATTWARTPAWASYIKGLPAPPDAPGRRRTDAVVQH